MKTSKEPVKTIAIIGGSGLASALDGVLDGTEHFADVENEWGIVLSYYVGIHGDKKVVILPRHGDSEEVPGCSPAELVAEKGYEANIWQLYKLGADAVIGFSAVGSLNSNLALADEGVFVVPHAYMRGLGASQHSFGNVALSVHPRMDIPFDDDLRDLAIKCISEAGCTPRTSGLYIYSGGDCFETAEEISVLDRMTRHLNIADRLVGMTTIPEAMLLAQMHIPFAAICSNVNYAEGISATTEVSHRQTLDVIERARPHILKIVEKIIEEY